MTEERSRGLWDDLTDSSSRETTHCRWISRSICGETIARNSIFCSKELSKEDWRAGSAERSAGQSSGGRISINGNISLWKKRFLIGFA